MRLIETGLDGLQLIEHPCFEDERGFFTECFRARDFREAGIQDEFVQENHSRSGSGILRGLHYQIKHPQAQIVTVTRGLVFDVAVDLRPWSPTFGRWFGAELGEGRVRQVYMAPGFAHGFVVLSEWADLHYKVSEYYNPTDEAGVLWNDPDLAIVWPRSTPTVSRRDSQYPRFRNLPTSLLPHQVMETDHDS